MNQFKKLLLISLSLFLSIMSTGVRTQTLEDQLNKDVQKKQSFFKNIKNFREQSIIFLCPSYDGINSAYLIFFQNKVMKFSNYPELKTEIANLDLFAKLLYDKLDNPFYTFKTTTNGNSRSWVDDSFTYEINISNGKFYGKSPPPSLRIYEKDGCSKLN